jgi:hypothetical protein
MMRGNMLLSQQTKEFSFLRKPRRLQISLDINKFNDGTVQEYIQNHENGRIDISNQKNKKWEMRTLLLS